MDRTTVLLLFGGESSEHDVSIASARNVYAAIDNAKFDVILGYIDRYGKWWLLDRFGSEINTRGLPQLAPVLGSGSFVSFPSSRIVKPDVILPILHGKNGEDGSVQGMAQLLHIPIVGCEMTASAICMDKVATKEILAQHGLPVVPYVTCRRGEVPDFRQLSMKLGVPLFVKPVRGGSSVGVSKVHSEEELSAAVEGALQHDDIILIERGIAAREIDIAVLGNPPHVQTSVAGEDIANDDFLSYDTKYGPTSKAQLAIPADISPATAEKLDAMARTAYEALGCRGLSRVDFFLTNDDTIYINEINTLPGFTNASVYPKLWKHVGISYAELIERLLSLAVHDTIVDNETEV
ncbi:D-alanine--D-alanine ligase [Streptomyces caniscabiei]|uniref:D-alanine--D-alanine ligase family protein n=1 Tax=Streptomyces caniscabiei TaxID=2746961 RepID=UPI0029B58A6E|nr:D-alanine--D-alanine ligase family protein [Streptomyces caniscabiei]MDX2775783.1 D-alanine--D-alanine ligase [Streptomyces caniscabiei]